MVCWQSVTLVSLNLRGGSVRGGLIFFMIFLPVITLVNTYITSARRAHSVISWVTNKTVLSPNNSAARACSSIRVIAPQQKKAHPSKWPTGLPVTSESTPLAGACHRRVYGVMHFLCRPSLYDQIALNAFSRITIDSPRRRAPSMALFSAVAQGSKRSDWPSGQYLRMVEGNHFDKLFCHDLPDQPCQHFQ